MTKIPLDDVLESLYKLRIREFDQLKTVLEIVRHGNSSKDAHAQLSEIEDDGEEKYRSETSDSRNFDARHERIETGAVVASRRGSCEY